MADKFIINASDLQGLTRMITDASVNITDLVQDMQHRIVHPAYLPSTPIQHLITGIAGLTYNSTRFGMKFIGGGLDKILGFLHPVMGEGVSSREKESFRAILNGVLGDYLENSQNPLSIPMQFRYQGKKVELDSSRIKAIYPADKGKMILMVHGLCMNDLKWRRNDHDHGEKLAGELNMTPVYLQYNSGRHISTNGQNLNDLLEQLVTNWPQPIEELHIVAHSMGGLVSRSAIHYGTKQKKSWTSKLRNLIFLGTPHHGTSLERAGNYVDLIMGSAPYVKPFTRLTKVRSAGITDLRYGNLVDEDWAGMDRFKKVKDSRTFIPLPEHVPCYNIAATLGSDHTDLSKRMVGDGLVSVTSALGQHKDPKKNLPFKDAHCYISNESNHMDLLNKAEMYQQIKTWLSA